MEAKLIVHSNVSWSFIFCVCTPARVFWKGRLKGELYDGGPQWPQQQKNFPRNDPKAYAHKQFFTEYPFLMCE